MTLMAFKLVGGIGLFLLGMVLLTDGLKAFAGESLKRALMRFTGTPFKAFASGALVTAVVQSSSATTVTLIGFVSAGLLTFPQAVGVVFGTSLGTTSTGWIVSALGLRISVGVYALPLVAVGALMRLLARGRWKPLGLALAGLALIFLGLDTMREGMKGMTGLHMLAGLPAGGWWACGAALLIGFAMTVVMQSSSAAAATVLTALDAGSVNFEQGALLVIGAAVGTTVKGALVTIGARAPARRTALAHVTFNLATGLVALALLPLYLRGIRLAQAHLGLEPGPVSLAAFHTLFIAVGVALFLPFTRRFAGAIERLMPDRGPRLTAFLDASVLHVPAVALEATRRTMVELARELFGYFQGLLEARVPRTVGRAGLLEPVGEALDRTREFFAAIPTEHEQAPLTRARTAQLHALDHLARLAAHAGPPPGALAPSAGSRLAVAMEECGAILELAVAGVHGGAAAGWPARLEEKAAVFAERHRTERAATLARTAAGEWAPERAIERLDAMRWLDRVAYHAWRIGHYLGGDGAPEQGRGDLSDAKQTTPDTGS